VRARIDHCTMPVPFSMIGYFLWHNSGDYLLSDCLAASSRDQHEIRGIASVRVVRCDFTNANNRECITQQGGTLIVEDSIMRNGDIGIGPLSFQNFTVTKATIQRTKFINCRTNIVGNVGDVLLEDLSGSSSFDNNFVGIGYSNPAANAATVGRTINSLVMHRLTASVSGKGKIFDRAAAPVAFNTEPVGP
jgi:hypothetical protein